MQIDLARLEARREPFRAKVCVVGGGIAGITLAHALMRRNVGVMLLEAGGLGLESRGQSLFAQARLAGRPHMGTREGRFRALGGSSLRWGGQLLRMPEAAGVAWPVGAAELAAHQDEAERLLGVDGLPFAADDFFRASGAARPAMLDGLGETEVSLSKWTPFARRNLAQTLGRELLRDAQAQIFVHAQVAEVSLAEGGARAAAVVVRTLAGQSFRFEAEEFVIAAGTVETSRLLLASQSVMKAGVGNTFGQVGRGFHDHPTLPVAAFAGAARKRILKDLRPWVFAETVHSVKMEASPALSERMGWNPVLAHVTIEEPEGSGVAVVRETLTALQQGGVGRVLRDHLIELPGAVVQAARLGWAAKVAHRRFVSARAAVTLQMNVAQDVATGSGSGPRVSLSDERDVFGMPVAVVDWRVSEQEIATLRGFAGYLKERFVAMGLGEMAWVPKIFEEGASLPGMDDARHAMGGAAMGVDPATSVVNAELKVHGVDNLWVASAAIFPTGSPQLPTLPLMALTLRLAERLSPK
jgi:choline dehydrogenase-like flavoprotein